MPAYQLYPQDVLYFGKAQAEASNSLAGGAEWPNPSTAFHALHAALHRAFPQVMLWEHTHPFGKNGRYPNRNERPHRFGSLATVGPFPCREEQGEPCWFFVCPADAAVDSECSVTALRPLRDAGGSSNLPKPLRYLLGNPCAGSELPRPWWAKSAIEAYLRLAAPPTKDMLPTQELYREEPVRGLSLDAAGELEQAQAARAATSVRLAPDVSLGVLATMPLKVANYAEGLDQLLANEPRHLLWGGQQRACLVRNLAAFTLEQLLPISQPIAADRVKWLLLSPAIYPMIERTENRAALPHPGGWLPNWVCPDTGQVLLKRGDTQRRDASREDWRRRVRELPALDCRLVAARIPKPLAISGWSERRHLRQHDLQACAGATPTYLAARAGSVYYFEGPDAGFLAEALSWHGPRAENEFFDQIVNRRSTWFGEQGFGLGVCGPWEFY